MSDCATTRINVHSLLAQWVYTQAHVPAPESIYGHDTSPTLLYALTDSEGSVVGLADEIGQLVCQYAYTPFGELCHSEVMATGPPERLPDLLIAAAGNRIGHQGLRFERYDTPWAGALQHASVYPIGAPQAIPADAYTPVHGQYHNRNRMYSPALGRFLSRDPNALGTPVLGDLSYAGMTLDASDVGPDLTTHYADGLNTHAAYGGNPLTRSDVLGLMTTAHLAPLAPGIATRILHNMLWGIGVGGVMGYMQDGWRGAASGAVAGAVGGGVFGAMSGGAFASGAGLLARVSSGATAAGVSGWAGGFAGSAVQQDLRGQSFNLQLALADANWGMAVGILTGGVGGAFTRGQADDILLRSAGFGGSSFCLRAYYTANELTSHGWGGDRLTRAAVDLRKHPNILGVGNVQALVRSSAIELNQLANDVIERILANASSGRALPSGDIDIPLPGAAQGLGARFSSDGTFRYFTGMPGRNN